MRDKVRNVKVHWLCWLTRYHRWDAQGQLCTRRGCQMQFNGESR